jgi:hypothetical protein
MAGRVITLVGPCRLSVYVQANKAPAPLFLLKITQLNRKLFPEAEFLDEIQTKVLRAFLFAIHSPLYSFALRFLFLQTHATSVSTVRSCTL